MKSITFFTCDIAGCGGTERVGLLIANEFCKRGYNVSILSYVNDGDPFFTCDPRIKRGVVLQNKWEKKFKRFQQYVNWKIRFFLRKWKTDVFIDINSDMTRISGPAVDGTGVKHISWAHFNFEYCTVGEREQENLKCVLRYADKLVVLTKEDRENYLNKTNIRKDQITQIYNPIPFSGEDYVFHPQKRVLALGRISPEKGFDMLVKAWALVEKCTDGWMLEIVNGGGDDSELKLLIEELNLNRVVISPRTNDVKNKYKEAGLYVLSSRFEGFPMVLLEAAAMSVPLVAFNVHTGPKEFIQNGTNGFLVTPESIEDLAKTMILVMNDESLRVKLSREAFESSKKFTAERIIQNWITLIDNI